MSLAQRGNGFLTYMHEEAEALRGGGVGVAGAHKDQPTVTLPPRPVGMVISIL